MDFTIIITVARTITYGASKYRLKGPQMICAGAYRTSRYRFVNDPKKYSNFTHLPKKAPTARTNRSRLSRAVFIGSRTGIRRAPAHTRHAHVRVTYVK